MASAASSLSSAMEAVSSAFDKLEAAIAYAQAERHNAVEAKESIQAEITASWEAHSAKLEADLAETQAETSFLKDDNTRLSTQLETLQHELLALQTTASGTMKKLDKSVKQLDLILERA